MKPMTLLAMLFATITMAKAQNFSQSEYYQKMNAAPYVFEGVIEDIHVYAGDQNGNKLPDGVYTLADGTDAIAYSSAKVQVCKIYKGNNVIKNGTVEIITTGEGLIVFPETDAAGKPVTAHAYFPSSHSEKQLLYLQKSVGNRYVFFAGTPKFTGSSGFPFDNIVGIYPTDYFIQYSPAYEKTRSGVYAYGAGINFYSQAEIESFLHTFSNLDFSSSNVCDDTGQIDLNEGNDEIPSMSYQLRLNNYNSWITSTQSYLPKENSNTSRASTQLILEMDNEQITGTNSSNVFFEFDIMASASDNTTYFDRCLIRLHYSTFAFGANMVANNNIVITRGPTFNNSTYDDPNALAVDIASDTIAIPFGTDFDQASWNRTALTIFPIQLFHVKIRIQNCNALTGFSYENLATTSLFSWYTLTPNDDILNTQSYALTDYLNAANDYTCVPIIDAFTDYVPAGIHSTFTINGNYFGQNIGSIETVIFKNANVGNLYPPATGPKLGGVEDYDILSWSDDEIQIRLPAIINDIPDPVSGNPVDPIPGSGKFKVVNFTGLTTESSTPATIPYAVFEGIDMFPTYKKVQVSFTEFNGYNVHCNPNLEATYPGARAIVERALKDWTCVSHINWFLGNDTNLIAANDGINVITLNSFSALQKTIRQIVPCPGTDTFYLKSFDIEINYPLTFPYDWQINTTGSVGTNKYDFYHAISHEFGHAHMLEHINDSLGDVMFWAAHNGPYPEIQRKRVWLSPGAMGGASWAVFPSYGLVWVWCFSIHNDINTPTDCTGLSVEEDADGFSFNLFPNPSPDEVTITFHLKSQARVRYVLYNELGEMVRTTQELETVGDISEGLYIGDLAAGAYFLQVIVNDVPYIGKLIKN